MTFALPRLRTDLTIRAQENGGERFFIIKDPVSGQFFRFREAEEFITRQFDGETPLDVVRSRVQDRFGATLAPETLQAFAKNLELTGLLEGERSGAKRGRRGRIRGSLLYLRFKVLDPTRIFDRIIPWIGFCFTPYFLALSALMILLAADVAVVNWPDLLLAFRGLLQSSSIPLYVTFALLTVMLHEFGHGLTCRHFGGEVHEIGFLLVYFQPALYCNVSDAWLFPEKSKRMWVAFAGPWFELFVWSIAVQVWRATEADTLINQCALAVVAISGAKTLFNFNPLIKLDGYYLLSDLLEIPNLRAKSFRGLGDFFRRLTGGKVEPHEGETARDRRIYLIYGLIAASGSFSLMGALLITAFRYLGDGSKPLILALPIIAGLGLRGRQWMSRLSSGAAKPATGLDEDEDFESPATAAPAAAPPGEARKESRRQLRWVRRIVWIGAVALVVAAVAKQAAPLRVAGAFNLLPAESTDVRVTVDGLVDRLCVNEGDVVKAGDLFAVLSDRDLRANLEKTEAQIREAKAALRMLQAGPTENEIAVAEAAVAKSAGHIEFAQKKLERAKMLFESGLVARSAYDDAEEQARAMASDVEEAKAKLTALTHNVRPEQIDEVAAQIDRLETDRRLVQQQLRSLQVPSPVDGVVGTPQRQLLQMAHQFVHKGDSLAKIFDFSKVRAQIVISEKEISEVQVGQPVELRARAVPEAAFHGKVTFISTTAAAPPTATDPTMGAAQIGKALNVVFVNTEIDNRSLLLKPEMTGQARIDCGRKRIADLLAWHLRRYFRSDSFSW